MSGTTAVSGAEGAQEGGDVGFIGAEGDLFYACGGEGAMAGVASFGGTTGVGYACGTIRRIDDGAGAGFGVLQVEQADIGKIFFARVGERERDDLVAERGSAELSFVVDVEEIGEQKDDAAPLLDA